MLIVLFLVFILVPAIELSVLVRVSDVLGVWTTISLCLFTAIVGASLVRSQGIQTLLQAQQKLASGQSPNTEVVEGILLAMAGVLLLIPGFVTDFIGLCLLTPFTRKPIASYILKRAQLRFVNQNTFGFNGNMGRSDKFQDSSDASGNVFEGEFERQQEASRRLDPDASEEKKDKQDNDKS